MKIIQYGAGNIGRSLVGQLFSHAGWEVVFVDIDTVVIDALNREKRYRILVKEANESEIQVTGVRGVHGTETEKVISEIATCDLLSTAVGPAILPRIAPVIAQGLAQRDHPLNILLCENLRGAPEIVRDALMKALPADFPVHERTGLIATSIGKMVPIMPSEVRERDPLEVWAEAYNRIVADRNGFIGPIPEVPGLVVRGCFEAYVDQKLFVHNLGHATAAYHGDLAGCKTIAEAMKIPAILRSTRGAMEESGRALVRLYSQELTETDMQEHITDLCQRFGNQALGDTVFRVGRDRPRKYAPNDRLMGAIKAQHKAGIETTFTVEAAAAGILFSATDEKGERHPGDVAFEQFHQEQGVQRLLQHYSGLSPEDPFDREIIEQIKDRFENHRSSRG